MGRDEKRAPLKTPAWEATVYIRLNGIISVSEVPAESCKVCKILSIALIILFTSAGRAGEGKRRNEFVEWHVARLAE